MDTNYLLKREQVSLMMARRATNPEARHAHGEMARGYGRILAGRRFPHRHPAPLAEGPSESENPDRGCADRPFMLKGVAA